MACRVPRCNILKAHELDKEAKDSKLAGNRQEKSKNKANLDLNNQFEDFRQLPKMESLNRRSPEVQNELCIPRRNTEVQKMLTEAKGPSLYRTQAIVYNNR